MLLILLLNFLSLDVHDLRDRMSEAMAQLDKVEISIELSDAEGIITEAKVWRDQGKHRLQYGVYDILMTENYFITVIHASKQIFVQKVSSPQLAQMGDMLYPQSLSDKLYENVEVEKRKGNYELSFPDQGMKMIVDKKSYRLVGFAYQFDTETESYQSYVSYTYETIAEDPHVFDVENYIHIDHEGYRAADGFEDYIVTERK